MSHLSVVLDLPPAQWHRSARHDPPLALPDFLSHVLVFLNAHIANNAENSLAVFGAFPGTSPLLYSSADPVPARLPIDSNSYPSFVHLDHAVARRVTAVLDSLGTDRAPEPSALVGAITKALCCPWSPITHKPLLTCPQMSTASPSPPHPPPRPNMSSRTPVSSSSPSLRTSPHLTFPS